MLNKDEPHTRIVGCNKAGARFHQKGKAFNAKGEEVSWETGKIIEKKRAPKRTKLSKPEAIKEQGGSEE